MDVQGVSTCTISSVNMQGISIFVVSSVDVQGVSVYVDVLGVSVKMCWVFPFPPPDVWTCRVNPSTQSSCSVGVQGVSIVAVSNVDLHGVFLFTASSIEVQGVSFFTLVQCFSMPDFTASSQSVTVCIKMPMPGAVRYWNKEHRDGCLLDRSRSWLAGF
jgi:hypothetical protein